jgi:hypothetical protein
VTIPARQAPDCRSGACRRASGTAMVDLQASSAPQRAHRQPCCFNISKAAIETAGTHRQVTLFHSIPGTLVVQQSTASLLTQTGKISADSSSNPGPIQFTRSPIGGRRASVMRPAPFFSSLARARLSGLHSFFCFLVNTVCSSRSSATLPRNRRGCAQSEYVRMLGRRNSISASIGDHEP